MFSKKYGVWMTPIEFSEEQTKRADQLGIKWTGPPREARWADNGDATDEKPEPSHTLFCDEPSARAYCWVLNNNIYWHAEPRVYTEASTKKWWCLHKLPFLLSAIASISLAPVIGYYILFWSSPSFPIFGRIFFTGLFLGLIYTTRSFLKEVFK